MPEATTPTSSDVRVPYIVRTNRSRPSPSEPNQNCEFGPLRKPELVERDRLVRLRCSGGPVIQAAIGPPKKAMKMRSAITNSATSAALSSRNRSQKSRAPLRPR